MTAALGRKKLLGFHPTPDRVVVSLALRVVRAWEKKGADKRVQVKVVDLFAGDGRLGRAVVTLLGARGWTVSITFVEVDAKRIGRPVKTRHEKWAIADALSWLPSARPDIVVANPPYLGLNVKRAQRLGLAWGDVLVAGRNLFGAGLLRCFELCRPGGIVGVVGPFGWTKGRYAEPLRERLGSLATWVRVDGYSSRSMFSGVHQDIGVCIGQRSAGGTDGSISVKTKTRALAKVVPIEADSNSKSLVVKCGSVVWNRAYRSLSVKKPKTIPLVFGGNIRHDGRLSLAVGRYAKRQYIKRSKVLEKQVVVGPALMIRRVMRGRPGEWKVDACVLRTGLRVAAENHVIVVSSTEKREEAEWREVLKDLTWRIEQFFRHSGQPTLSTKTVAQLAGQFRAGRSSRAKRAA